LKLEKETPKPENNTERRIINTLIKRLHWNYAAKNKKTVEEKQPEF
jgi:hypothetical protein